VIEVWLLALRNVEYHRVGRVAVCEAAGNTKHANHALTSRSSFERGDMLELQWVQTSCLFPELMPGAGEKMSGREEQVALGYE